jgi:hypothetical protein
MDCPLIEEPGKEQAKQIVGDGGDGGFRGQIPAVEMIDPSDAGVGNNQLVG